MKIQFKLRLAIIALKISKICFGKFHFFPIYLSVQLFVGLVGLYLLSIKCV